MLRENLNIFVQRFGQPVTFTLADECERRITAIFDDSFFDSNVGETVLDTTQPRLTCRTSDLQGIPLESIVEVGGKIYSVVKFQPDGTGMSVVILAHE